MTIPIVKDKEDERMCEIEANKAILALKLNGGGPAHINMYTRYSHCFNVEKIPHVNAIFRHTVYDDNLPEIPNNGRIIVWVGSHADFSESLTYFVIIRADIMENMKSTVNCFADKNSGVLH